MTKIIIASFTFCILLTNAFAQNTTSRTGLFRPQNIVETIGEKYILLPVDSNKTNFGMYLHVWTTPSTDNLVPANEGGKTILTLKAITPDYHATLADSLNVVYNQYFKKGEDDALLFFTPLADYKKAREFINTFLWLKSNKKRVKVIDIQLTPDHNTPFLFTYQCADGIKDSVKVVLSGTNSTIKDKGVLFDNLFNIAKP
ncbi:hypothetical protein [Mucilaginibacter phyllosphaerae]